MIDDKIILTCSMALCGIAMVILLIILHCLVKKKARRSALHADLESIDSNLGTGIKLYQILQSFCKVIIFQLRISLIGIYVPYATTKHANDNLQSPDYNKKDPSYYSDIACRLLTFKKLNLMPESFNIKFFDHNMPTHLNDNIIDTFKIE